TRRPTPNRSSATARSRFVRTGRSRSTRAKRTIKVSSKGGSKCLTIRTPRNSPRRTERQATGSPVVLVVMILFHVRHVHGIIAPQLVVLAFRGVQVGLSRSFRAHGETGKLLFEPFAPALGAGGGRLQDQRLEVLPAIEAMKIV